MKKTAVYISTAAAVIFMNSCREELCYNHFGSASMDFSWPGTTDIPEDETPEGITVIVYDSETGESYEYYISGTGGDINFGSSGTHSMLIYNNDTERILFFDMSAPTSAYATSTPAGIKPPQSLRDIHPDEIALNPPDMLYAAYVTDLPDVDNHEHMQVPATMRPLVFRYDVRYEFEHGLNRVSEVRGALAGMAEEVIMHNGTTTSSTATIVYECSLTAYGAHADITSFGIPGYTPGNTSRASGRYTLCLEATLINGKSKVFNIDVTDQLTTQPRGGNITVSGLRVEDNEGSTDSGFDPDIDDWGDHEDIDFPIGKQ